MGLRSLSDLTHISVVIQRLRVSLGFAEPIPQCRARARKEPRGRFVGVLPPRAQTPRQSGGACIEAGSAVISGQAVAPGRAVGASRATHRGPGGRSRAGARRAIWAMSNFPGQAVGELGAGPRCVQGRRSARRSWRRRGPRVGRSRFQAGPRLVLVHQTHPWEGLWPVPAAADLRAPRPGPPIVVITVPWRSAPALLQPPGALATTLPVLPTLS
ncbi:hypothetical protein ES705_31939 [subsurface metagenome]